MSDEQQKNQSLWDVTQSALAALVGVQSSKKYEKDFTYGKAWHYVVIGVIGTAIFIGLVVGVVMTVLHLAT